MDTACIGSELQMESGQNHMAVQPLVAQLLVPARQARQGIDCQRAVPDCGLTHWSKLILHMLCTLCCAAHAVQAVIDKGAVSTTCAS